MIIIPDLFTPWIQGREAAIKANWQDIENFNKANRDMMTNYAQFQTLPADIQMNYNKTAIAGNQATAGSIQNSVAAAQAPLASKRARNLNLAEGIYGADTAVAEASAANARAQDVRSYYQMNPQTTAFQRQYNPGMFMGMPGTQAAPGTVVPLPGAGAASLPGQLQSNGGSAVPVSSRSSGGTVRPSGVVGPYTDPKPGATRSNSPAQSRSNRDNLGRYFVPNTLIEGGIVPEYGYSAGQVLPPVGQGQDQMVLDLMVGQPNSIAPELAGMNNKGAINRGNFEFDINALSEGVTDLGNGTSMFIDTDGQAYYIDADGAYFSVQ